MTVKDIMEYVMHTPENTNGVILRQMLNELATVDEDAIIKQYVQSLVALGENEIYATEAEDGQMPENRVFYIYDQTTGLLKKVVGTAGI